MAQLVVILKGLSFRIGETARVLKDVFAASAQAVANILFRGTRVYLVEGTVARPHCAGVGGLRIMIVDKLLNEDVTLAVSVTDEVGHYEARFPATVLHDLRAKQLDLQARVYTGDTFLGASDVLFNATDHETLNVLLPVDSPSR